MAGTFTPARGLDELVARMVAPEIGRAAADVARAAAGHAPPVKAWSTMLDTNVRPWHRSAEGQKAPANLRFKLEHSPRTHDPHPPGNELLRYPRDEEAYYLQTKDCRCFLKWDNGLAESITSGQAAVAGTTVTAKAWTDYARAVESEFGTDKDPPARFMGQGVRDISARMR